MKKASFLVFLLILSLSLFACGRYAAPATSFPPVPADYAGKNNPFGADAAETGAVNFNTYCEACHGAAGLGDGPAGQALNPKPASLPAVAAQVGDDYLFWRVSEGKLGTAMVGWAGVLNEEQIWQVIAYIRTLSNLIPDNAGRAFSCPAFPSLYYRRLTHAISQRNPSPRL